MVAKLVATSLGVGYLPVAPGTYGTAVAVPLAWALAGLPLWQFTLVVIGVTAIGIWAADRADRAWGTHDCQKICIDETAGYLVTVALVDRTHWVPLVVGFVLFRFFDQVKPPPVRWLDENLGGGWGVVLDDIAAGVMAMVVLVALDRFGALAWLARL